MSKPAGDAPCFLYVVAHYDGDDWLGPSKIGFSADPKARLVSLRTGSPRPLGLYATIALTRDLAPEIERSILVVRKDCLIKGEWFDLPPGELIGSAFLAVVTAAVIMGGIPKDEANLAAQASVRLYEQPTREAEYA